MQLHQAVIFLSFFSPFLFFSYKASGERALGVNLKVVWQRKEDVKPWIQLLCQKYCLAGKWREGTVNSSEVSNVMTEQVKGNLPVCTVYSLILGLVWIHRVGSLLQLSFKSYDDWWKIIKWWKHRHYWPPPPPLHIVKTVPFPDVIVSKSNFFHDHICQSFEKKFIAPKIK